MAEAQAAILLSALVEMFRNNPIKYGISSATMSLSVVTHLTQCNYLWRVGRGIEYA